VPPDPGELIATPSLGRLLSALRDRVDTVLVDSAPMLNVADAAAISRRVDGVVVATRLRRVDRRALHELNRQLSAWPAPVLGFVVTDADRDPGYGYAARGGYGRAAPDLGRSLARSRV
jgi:Mrp family chromosome partitioning ATPase